MMNFKYLLGNENVKEQISVLMESKRLPHAIVIEGEDGIGKKTFAREIATALVCRSNDSRPCYQCTQCHKAEKGIHPDIYEHTATGGAKSFHIDTVRDIISDICMPPNEAEFKIYILGNAHCMNENAQNAILKVLEEPPAYAVFILTVENRSMLLETVLSRSVVLSLNGVSAKLGAEHIVNENPDIDYNSAFEAVTALRGNIGKAKESIIGGKMKETVDLVNNICSAIMADSEYELIKCVSAFSKDRKELATALSMLKIIFRDALVSKDTNEILSGQTDIVKALSSKYTSAKLLALFNSADELIEMTKKNANNALLITKICYTLRRATGR